jgi:hypothetical protein
MVLETREIGGADTEDEQELENHETRDLKPEYCHYRDEGCEYARSCLECPFPQCIYDEPGGRQRWLKKARDRKIRQLYVTGKKVKELAELFGVSHRTIQRALGSG